MKMTILASLEAGDERRAQEFLASQGQVNQAHLWVVYAERGEKNVNQAHLWVAMGTRYAQRGEKNKARESLDKAMQVASRILPEDTRAWTLADIVIGQAEAGDYEKARQTADLVTGESPRLFGFVFQIAVVGVEILALVAGVALFRRRQWARVALRAIACMVAVLLGLYLLMMWAMFIISKPITLSGGLVLSRGEYTALVLIEGWLLIIVILLGTHRLKTAVGEPR